MIILCRMAETAAVAVNGVSALAAASPVVLATASNGAAAVDPVEDAVDCADVDSVCATIGECVF